MWAAVPSTQALLRPSYSHHRWAEVTLLLLLLVAERWLRLEWLLLLRETRWLPVMLLLLPGRRLKTTVPPRLLLLLPTNWNMRSWSTHSPRRTLLLLLWWRVWRLVVVPLLLLVRRRREDMGALPLALRPLVHGHLVGQHLRVLNVHPVALGLCKRV